MLEALNMISEPSNVFYRKVFDAKEQAAYPIAYPYLNPEQPEVTPGYLQLGCSWKRQ
jgi:hypothetical protein